MVDLRGFHTQLGAGSAMASGAGSSGLGSSACADYLPLRLRHSSCTVREHIGYFFIAMPGEAVSAAAFDDMSALEAPVLVIVDAPVDAPASMAVGALEALSAELLGAVALLLMLSVVVGVVVSPVVACVSVVVDVLGMVAEGPFDMVD